MPLHTHHRPALPRARRSSRGLSLVELMVALALGLVLVVGVASVYLFTKTAFSRQAQLSTLQQSVRTAFEYLGSDARMVGHQGCATSSTTPLRSDLSDTAVATNFAVGIQGYEYKNPTAGAYTLGSDSPADVSAASDWEPNNLAAAEPKALPIADLGNALSPGSDVLVIRTVIGKPLRLTANTATAGTSIDIESVAGGKCSGGADKVSGFCAGSYGLIASCADARVFRVTSIAGSKLTVPAPLAPYKVFSSATAEVFPYQTIAYYVRRSSSGTTTSLYRRVFDGQLPATEQEQELIEDVETLQVRYGRDTTAPDADGTVDDYETAEKVGDWSRVVTVRMSLLMRSATPVPADTKVAAAAPVNGVTVTFPSGSRYDRRVFTTTVALRNKIAYFQTP